MKIYIQDRGWRGSILVIAKDEQQAREFMSDAQNYDPKREVETHDIKEGFIYIDLGDT